MRPVFDALNDTKTQSTLPGPHPKIIDSAKKMTKIPDSREEKIDFLLNNMRLNAGSQFPVDEDLCRPIAEQVINIPIVLEDAKF